MENSKQSAFGYGLANNGGFRETKGLTKREYFAGLAMQGMISSTDLNLSKQEANIIAWQSIQFADELLKELEKKINNE